MTIAHTPRETVMRAFELREQNPEMSCNAISKVIGVHRDTVQRWFRLPSMNPYLDDIAIERALKGDVAVFEALTNYEREAVLTVLGEKRELVERFPLQDRGKIFKSVDHLAEKVGRPKREVKSRTPESFTAKLTPENVEKIHALREQGMSQNQIARTLGMSQRSVGRALPNAPKKTRVVACQPCISQKIRLVDAEENLRRLSLLAQSNPRLVDKVHEAKAAVAKEKETLEQHRRHCDAA